MKIGARDEALYRRILDLQPTKGDRKRMMLLEALIDALAEDGWENVSFETLGRRVDMQKGHVAYYFPTREDMIHLAVRYAFAVGQEMTIVRVAGDARWEDRMRGWVEAPFDWLVKYPKHSAVVRLLFYLASYDDRFRQLNTQIRSMGVERASWLLEEKFRGRLGPAKRRTLAKEIQELITGAILGHVSIDSDETLTDVRDRTVSAVFRTLELLVGPGRPRSSLVRPRPKRMSSPSYKSL